MLVFLYVLACHYVADFVLQSHWMASNKSRRNDALALHVSIYSLAMTIGVSVILPEDMILGAKFLMVTFATHFVTDYVTSRMSSALWQKQQWHNFFLVIGADQLIHQATLAATLIWLGTKY